VNDLEAAGPNAQQIKFWNEDSGARWVEMSDVIDAQIAPLGEAAMDGAQVEPDERVLDVGCGCGQTTLELARRVGERGSVLGLDLSSPMLVHAAERARSAEISNIEFRSADAQTHELPKADFDLIFSRFGVMFFASPEAAFANLLTALRPGGRLTFVAWQELNRNLWMKIPFTTVAQHLPPADPPPSPPDPDSPGPFSFSDKSRVEGILRTSGFEGIRFDSLERDLLVGGGRPIDETGEFLSQLGPAGALLREADPAVRSEVMSAVRKAIEPYNGVDGVRMPAAAWIVSARRPD
jgi:SAM-dependent methyltransferase